MEHNFALIPVNKTAAIVTSKGFEYSPEKIITTNDSDYPILTRKPNRAELGQENWKDLIGFKFGRFVVIGLSRDFKSSWVVRCKCGKYTTRRKKAILNVNNTQDRCEHCRQLSFLKRQDIKRTTGKDVDINQF